MVIGGVTVANSFNFTNNQFFSNNNTANTVTTKDNVVLPQLKKQSFSSEKQREMDYSCVQSGNDVVMNGMVGSKKRPIMGFNSDKWGPRYPKLVRCNIVSSMLQRYGTHHITTGVNGEYAIFCASEGALKGCMKDERGGQILTLGIKGVSSQQILNKFLVSLNPSMDEASVPPFINTESRVYVDLYKMVNDERDYYIIDSPK
jgi:Circadian oscillating protein COP23